MKTYSTLTAVLAVAAVSAPIVAQAQDPATAYKQVLELVANGQGAQAIQLCDQIIQVYGNPKSRVAQQFIHMVPFFYYQKGNVLFQAKMYAEAYEAFHILATEPTFQKKELIARAHEIPGNPQGYDPLITMAKFYSGYCLFQMAVGNPPSVPGDPSKFDQAIPELEAYLKLYESGKVSAQEKKAKLDGSICFLLMQAYILKPEPDFQKAGEYLDRSQKARAPLSDEMAMSGLMSVVKVALQNPQYIDWCYRIVSANPESFNLGAARMAPYGGQMLNYGGKAVEIGKKFMASGDVKGAAGAFRSANMFFGLVPDSPVVIQTLTNYSSMVKLPENSKVKVIPDNGLGIKHNPANYSTLIKSYQKFTSSKQYPEGFAVLQQANIGYTMGSLRIAKAGYRVVIDRYPDLSQVVDGKPKSMKNANLNQYSQLCLATGDEETAEKVQGQVDQGDLKGDARTNAIVQRMNRCVKEQRWEDAAAVADELIAALGDDKSSKNYVAAVMTKMSAKYKMATGKRDPQLFQDVITEGEALLAEGDGGALHSSALKPDEQRLYTTQVTFFVLHAYHELATLDASNRAANLGKCIELAQSYIKDFGDGIDSDPLGPNVYYFAVDCLLKRMNTGDEAAQKADRTLALKYCDEITTRWPNHALTPICYLIGGQILISGTYADDEEENREKDRGLVYYEKACESSLQMEKKDYNIAAEALFLLYSYGVEYTREGEDDAAKQKRIDGYAETFWTKVYQQEGGSHQAGVSTHALKLAATSLSRATSGKDKDAYQAALDLTQKVIVSEAKYGQEHNINDPELEKTINTYAASYVDGHKKLLGKEFTMQERVTLFKEFPGISKDNRYASAILRMCALRAITDEQTAVRRNKELSDADKKTKVAELQRMVDEEMDAFVREYKPDDLSNYICWQVGERLLSTAEARRNASGGNFKETYVDNALAYFDKVIERGGDKVQEARLGRAKTLALSNDDGRKKESETLFTELANCGNRAVANAALVGVTRLHMRNGRYAEAVKSAEPYVASTKANASQPDTVEMHMMFAEALVQTGDLNRAIHVYTNVFNGNLGAVSVSAPACKALMELYWNRNNAASGDRNSGNFKPSDRWMAWNTGSRYVQGIKNSGIDKKIEGNPEEREAFQAVEKLVLTYGNDPTVAAEEKANKNYAKATRNK